MPYRSSRRRKKATYRFRKRKSAIRSLRSQIISSTPPAIYITRQVASNVLTSGSTEQYTAYNFTLSQLPSYTELQSVFKNFCIKAVRVRVYNVGLTGITTNPSFDTTNTGIIPAPMFYMAVDLNNYNAVPINELQQLNGVRTCNLNTMSVNGKPIMDVTFKPKPAAVLYGTGGRYAIPKGDTWVSTAYPGTEHYGLKVGMDPIATSNSNQAYRVRLEFQYLIGLKGIQ